MSNVNMWEIENGIYDEGFEIICGVDEAGRGPLAGPVCAAAVILPKGLEIPGLTDSKKLTDKTEESSRLQRRDFLSQERLRPLYSSLQEQASLTIRTYLQILTRRLWQPWMRLSQRNSRA